MVGAAPIGVGNEVQGFVQMANQTADTPELLGFVDPANRDFHLLADSPLRDAGVAAPELMLVDDLEGAPRDDGLPDVGALEFDPDPPATGSTGADETGTAGTTGEGATGESGATGGAATSDSGAPTGGASAESGDTPTQAGPTGGGISSTGDTTGDSTGATAGEATDGGCGCRGDRTGAGAWALSLLLLVRRRSARRSAAT